MKKIILLSLLSVSLIGLFPNGKINNEKDHSIKYEKSSLQNKYSSYLNHTPNLPIFEMLFIYKKR